MTVITGSLISIFREFGKSFLNPSFKSKDIGYPSGNNALQNLLIKLWGMIFGRRVVNSPKNYFETETNKIKEWHIDGVNYEEVKEKYSNQYKFYINDYIAKKETLFNKENKLFDLIHAHIIANETLGIFVGDSIKMGNEDVNILSLQVFFAEINKLLVEINTLIKSIPDLNIDIKDINSINSYNLQNSWLTEVPLVRSIKRPKVGTTFRDPVYKRLMFIERAGFKNLNEIIDNLEEVELELRKFMAEN